MKRAFSDHESSNARGPGASAVERARSIAALSRPGPAVRAMSAQEFYLAVAGSGPDEGALLLRHGSRHQIDFLVDLTSWTEGEFDAGRFAEQLLRLWRVDPELVARWLVESDESAVVLALSRMLRIFKLDESVDENLWPPEKRLPSLDGVYFIEARDETGDAAQRALWDGLGLVRAQQPHVYEALLEQVLWAIPAEQEEEAFASRESRLAERGFPGFDEALGLWAGDPRGSLALRQALVDGVLPGPAPSVQSSPIAPLVPPALAALEGALSELPGPRLEQVLHDTLRVGNRFAVASLEHLADPKTHTHGHARAQAFLNLGLDLISRVGEAPRPSEVLSQTPVPDLVRLGVTAVQERVARARRLYDEALAGLEPGSPRPDLPIRLALDGLLAPRPVYADESGRRAFRDVSDLESIDALLDGLEALAEFVLRVIDAPHRGWPDLEPLPTGYRSLDTIEWSSIALTSLARVLLGDAPSPRPLALAKAARAREALLEDTDVGCRLSARALAESDALGLRRGAALLEERLASSESALDYDQQPDPAVYRALLFVH